MSRTSDKLSVPSLARHFDAPEHFVGHFGWLCGYSADALFLNDAAERFTGLTSAQRAHQGQVSLAVALDPGNPQISLLDAPGVAHLPIKDFSKKPFRLLHAKVALLGFRHQHDRERWCLRLIVSTGNWTRQTLEESLDLAWRIDVTSDALNELDDQTQRCCADLKAAYGLITWIHNLFDGRLLEAASSTGRREQVDAWIALCSKKASGQPRVFDSRKASLLAQLPAKIAACSSVVARNYLAMGSGFYEAAATLGAVPKVPQKVVDTLSEEALLTRSPELDLYVNDAACQGVATSVKALNRQGFKIRKAVQPTAVFGADAKRTLHAKFLFSANYRDNSSVCNSAWVYLGSGNLTNPGFASKMNASTGNLEAGVVFAPHPLYWASGQGIQSWQVVTNLLPIQWDSEFGDDDQGLLSSGGDFELRDEPYLASPIAWLRWHERKEGNELKADGDLRDFSDVAVLDAAGNECPKCQTGFKWSAAQPRQVRLRWKSAEEEHEANIPVIDQYGRVAATELPKLDVVDAWWQLANFPMPPDDDEDLGEERGNSPLGLPGSAGRAAHSINYPIRQMMELVESIAAKQTEINEEDWVLWCNRLEQALNQASESPVIKAFHELRINPLSPLRAVPFRPFFAETSQSSGGRLYEDVLSRVEHAWVVEQLSEIR
ncbi:phospholipase D-like domain-containing protein [Ralstonia flatus]|uniref:Phospholipase D-like domain-containing protein n=1 Tax=Ralstonia flatus TaxID=3058601 RepID=A0ABM9KZN5_9RALS|nr:hypothetical protein [Ralstonia sp. LMG 32965]MBN6209431.1 hypothetical protein [Ralstonia pickettii]CAJ0893556.1 hypothetical protein R77564_03722 [Ralstonia sp. LMG 32965]